MKDNQKLYRFIPFSELVDICENPGQLILKSPRLWDDNFEGYFYKKLMNTEGMIEIFNKLKLLIKESDCDINAMGENVSMTLNITTVSEKAILAMLRYSALYYLVFCISWSKKNESDALWRIYNYNNRSIRISSRISNFKKLKYITFSKIAYINSLDDNNIIDEVIFRDIEKDVVSFRIFKPFCSKRKAFLHEVEVRMFYFHELPRDPIFKLYRTKSHTSSVLNYIKDNISNCIDQKGNLITSLYKNLLDYYLDSFKSENTAGINLSKKGLTPNDIVDDVMIHPLAPKYYVKIIKKYCERFDLNFLGKSKLYEFE